MTDPETIAAAIRAHQPLPPMPDNLSMSDAYRLQAEMAALVSPGGFAGIKAGVTSPALQKNFGIDHALLGRLYESGRLAPDAVLPFVEGQLLECEIGLIVDADGHPESACLTIEFAFLKFANAQDASAANLVAANVATDAFMASEPVSFAEFNKGIVKLYRDDDLVNEAAITESLGGPVSALQWIRREAAQHQIPMPEGALVMTGACGKVLPAVPGNYRAVCESLGELSFSIES